MPPQPSLIPNTPPQPNVPPVPVPLTPEKIAEESYRFCKSQAHKRLSADV